MQIIRLYLKNSARSTQKSWYRKRINIGARVSYVPIKILDIKCKYKTNEVYRSFITQNDYCCSWQTVFCLDLAVPLMFVSFLKQPVSHAFNMRRERNKLPNGYVFSVRKLNGKENSGRKQLYIRRRKIHELCVTLLRPISWTMAEEII